MSGRDGGDGGPGGRRTSDVSCELLAFRAQLTSPKPEVVSTLSVGDILEVVVDSMNGQMVVKAVFEGQVAGGLAGPDVIRLRECIDQDHAYQAEVESVNGGQVRVSVTHT